MKRIFRTALASLAVASLLFFAVIVLLWLRSYWVRDYVEFTTHSLLPTWLSRGPCFLGIYFLTDRGSMSVSIQRVENVDHQPGWWAARPRVTLSRGVAVDPLPFRHRFIFFRHAQLYTDSDYYEDYWILSFDLWAPALAAGLMPTLWFLYRQRVLRARHSGLFCRCGYDLRATPDRCPECGTVPNQAPRRAVGPKC